MRLVPVLIVLAACKRQGDDVPTGQGVFAEGCPTEDAAIARAIGVDARLPGDVAVGTRGDFLIANAHAAFVITRPDAGSTYWYYGGAVADAVAMDGCAPASDDGLDEMGLVLGELDLADVDLSVLRAFRGTSVEVVNDGANGEAAVVRVHGVDDTHWLVEYELVRRKVDDGGRPPSSSFGLDLTIDYVLEPDSPVLRVEWTFANPTDASRRLLSASLLSFDHRYDVHAYATDAISVAGMSLDANIPYVVATSGEGAYAWGVDHGAIAYMNIAGIDIALDLQQVAGNAIDLPPGASATRTSFLSVGPTDGPTATAPLVAAQPQVLPTASATMAHVDGVVVDEAGAPVPGARVELWADAGEGPGVIDLAVADADGRFRLAVPQMAPDPWTFQAIAVADGRDESAPVDVGAGDLTVAMGPAGTVELDITDANGPIPTRVVLRRTDGRRVDLWAHGDEDRPVPPGTYDYTITRGYEYEPTTGTITVPEGGAVALSANLERVVDTSGWMSIDTHVHSAESPDSRMDPGEQLLHAAAHGVDVDLHTEHEHVVDQHHLVEAMGLTGFVNDMVGEEMTATMPEHMTMFPIVPDGTVRGGPIRWYGKDIATLFAEMHDRTAGGVNILNHPGYMDLIGWDYVEAAPTLDDPTLLGLAADAELWSWELDGIEVMNGHGVPFADGNRRFEKWQSMLNAGHRVTAVGCSDDHGGDEVGFPRTYLESATDDPAAMDEVALVDAMKGGRAVVSAGAFARVSVDGQGPGALVAGGSSVDLALRVEAPEAIDVTHAVVFVNCDQVARIEVEDPAAVVKIDETVAVPVDGDAQIVVAAFGDGRLPDGLPQYSASQVPRVLTNPIYVDADGDGTFDAPGGRVCSYDVR